MEYELRTCYDSRASFYGKATVTEDNGTKTLRSYSTDVAYIKNGKAYVNGTYSQTTLRHIKEFLLQNGFEASTSKQIIKDYDSSRDTELEQEKESPFKAVNMACVMGQLLCDTPEDKNKWDKRMLGTINGIDFPEDWDTLTEEEKTRRLEGAKEQISTC